MKKLYTLLIMAVLSLQIVAQVSPLIHNNWQTFRWPYNAYYPLSDDGPNGHLGNACGYTSIARILHYWKYPVNGSGQLDFDDYFGHHWYVNFENLNLDYADMPYELDWNDPEEVYEQTARLFLACGAIGESIQIGFTDGIFRIPQALQEHMYYSDQMEVVQRWDYTKDEWAQLFRHELDNGRPLLIDGRTPDSPAPWEPGGWEGHFFVCDGYNEAGKFHINYMYGGISGYYDIDSMDRFSAYHRAIINFEPINVAVKEPGHDFKTEISLYPLPARQSCVLRVTNSHILPLRIDLYNAKGELLRNVARRAFTGQQEFLIETASLSAGIYFLKISGSLKTITKKIVVVD